MQKIQQRDKMREKKMAQLQVYELLNTVFLENLNDIQQTMLTVDLLTSKEHLTNICLKNLERCHKVRVYANKQMANISRIYSQSVGLLDMNFHSRNKKCRGVVDEVKEEFLTIPDKYPPVS